MKNLQEAQNLLEALQKLILQQSAQEWAETIDKTIRSLSTATHSPDPDQLENLYQLRDFWKNMEGA